MTEQAVDPTPFTQKDEGKVTDVTRYGDGDFGIEFREVPSGVTHGFRSTEWGDTEPEEGDNIVVYDRGGRVRGVDLNGERVFYLTDEQLRERHEKQVEEMNTARKERFAEQREELDARFDALPPEFQRRIELRRERNPDFRWQYESYEMNCCEQAVVFANQALHETDEDATRACEWLHGWAMIHSDSHPEDKGEDWAGWAPFNKRAEHYDYSTQKKLMPGMSDDHSGNTFGAALQLAYAFLQDPEDVPLMYGALAPLVGSEAYGDPIDLMEADEGAEDG